MHTAQIVYSDSYLAHHGILGQKWGVRRYQNPDGSLTSLGAKRYGSMETSRQKYNSAKNGLIKDYHNYNYTSKKAEIERANNVKNAKGLKNKYQEAFGYGSLVTSAKARAEFYENKSKSEYGSRQDRKKIADESRAYNNQQIAKYYTDRKNSDFFGNMIEDYTGSKLMLMHIKSLGGRDSTVGKEALLSVLTGGVANMILDELQYSSGKKAERYSKKIESTKAKKDYDVKSFDAITEDLKYKNGKTFYSVQDAKRDQQATADAYDKRIAKYEKKRDYYQNVRY